MATAHGHIGIQGIFAQRGKDYKTASFIRRVSRFRPTWIAGSSGYSIQNPVPRTLGSQLRLGPLPLNLEDWNLKGKHDINTLNQLKVPRYIGNSTDTIELQAFSDASIKAYAAAVYSRVTLPDGNIEVTLIAAKTRVAPLKSLPRVELCGALLLSRLINSVKAALKNYNAWCAWFAWFTPGATLPLFWLGSRTYLPN